MSKKTKDTERRPRETRPRVGRLKLAAATLSLCAVAAGIAATRFDPVRRAVGLRPLLATPAQGNANLPLSKEYVYAGGRLVATEEPTPAATPTPTPGGPPPTNLVATASLPTATTAEVRLSWLAPSPAPSSYVIERASVRIGDGLKSAYAALGQPVTGAPSTAAPYIDQTAVQGVVYAYRVKAIYGGGPSGYSNQDLATTFRYTGDDPLVGANVPGHAASPVLASNLTELRAVIEAVRALAGVGAGSWKSDPAPLLHGAILPTHFTELRENLNPALDALGIGRVAVDSFIESHQPVMAVHIQDVREKVR
jgi:hypothetical protein